LGDRPGAGRKPRLTEDERSIVVALAHSTPPGRLVRQPDGPLRADAANKEARWSLDAPTEEAHTRGIVIARSQIRRILQKEGIRGRRARICPAPQKGAGRRPLHRPTRQCDDPVRRRAWPDNAADVPSPTGLVG
jgi:hypothetical protein